MRRVGLHKVLRHNKRSNLLVGVRPIISPITMNPEIADVLPFLRTVARIEESSWQFAELSAVLVFAVCIGGISCDFRELAFIGPARQCHWAMVNEQFAMCHCRWPAKSSGFH